MGLEKEKDMNEHVESLVHYAVVQASKALNCIHDMICFVCLNVVK